MEWSLSLLLFMRHPLVVAEDSRHLNLMGEETRAVKPNHCSKVYTANLLNTFWSTHLLCFSWQSPARKWSPIQNREAKPKPRQTQLVSRVLTQAIKIPHPMFSSFHGVCHHRSTPEMTKERSTEKRLGWAFGKGRLLITLRHNLELGPYISSVYPHISIKSSFSSRYHLLSKEVPCRDA